MQIHRYEKLQWVLQMLRTGDVNFAHPSRWPDPYESRFLFAGHTAEHALVLGPDGKYHGGLPRRHDSVTANVTFINGNGVFVFAQCFIGKGSPESEWKWESGGYDTVRWSIDTEGYAEALRKSSPTLEVTLSPVTYLSDVEVQAAQQAFVAKRGRGFEQWCKDVIAPLSKKRLEFSDQREHRVIVIDTSHHRIRSSVPPAPPPTREWLTVNVKLAELMTDVVLHPTIPIAAAQDHERQLRDAGFHGAVTKSKLYSEPTVGTRSEKPVTPLTRA